ncbi:MAG: TAXI family TRAP transporter solute-binding subunit [Thermodesulfobacteriota bacterium]|nr:TAXI family TRAP transporter solute-binding subunit [Thermodesulfobacteriota bacterium]
MKKALIIFLFLCLAMPFLAEAKKVISIGTAPAGGAWFGLGGALADIITKNIEGVTAVAEVTGAAVDNVRFVGTKKIDIGFTIATVGQQGYGGEAPFKEKYLNLRTLVSNVQKGLLHVVVLKDSGMNYIGELKGKRVAVGPSGHGGLPRLAEIFNVLGFTFKDFTPVYLPYDQSITALGDRKVDAAVLYVAPPVPVISEVSLFKDINILELREADQKAILDKHGHYVDSFVPKGTYKGVDKDKRTVATPNIIIVDAGLDEELVYKITKALFENIDKFRAGHPSANEFTLEGATKGSLVPFHPGAIKYFKEKGVWKDK